MNCSWAIGLLPDLLLFLSNFSEIRGIVLHADPYCVIRVRNHLGRGFLLAGRGNQIEDDGRLVHVFFPGFYSEVLHPENGESSGNLQIVDGAEVSSKNAVLDGATGKWVLYGLGRKIPLLRRSMSGVVVSIALTTQAGTETSAAAQTFARSIGALYWSILVGHYKFRIRYNVIHRPEGDESFNSVRYTMEQFSQGGTDAIGDLFLISAERVEKLSFIIIGLEVKYHFIIRRPEYEYSWLAVVRPLAPSLWWGVLGMILGLALALGFIFRRAPGSAFRPNLFASVFLAFGICCSQVKLLGLKSTCTHLAFYSAITFFNQIQQFYVSNLYSMLATREIHYPFNSIEEFIERKKHRLAISPDTSVYTAFQAAENVVFRRVWKEFLENDPSHAINGTSMGEVIDRVCEGNTAIFALPLQVARYGSGDCPLIAVPGGYFPNDMAIATSKDFAYIPHFRALFLRTMEAGISQFLNEKYIKRIMPDIQATDVSVDPVAVAFHQVLLIFGVLAVGIILSVVILIFENLFYVRTRQNHPKKLMSA